MKSRALRWLAVGLVNLGILAGIELGSAWIIRKRFRKANGSYQHGMLVEHPFSLLTGWEMKANATIGDGRPTHIRTDAEGHAIVPDALPHPRFTLAVLGGSTMFGVGVGDNAANVPSQLQTALRREYGLEVNVVNLGARGYVSFQELLVLNQYLAEHPLDMVVSVSGHNDLMRYLDGERHPSYVKRPGSEAVALVRRVEAGNLVISNFIPAIRRISQTANLVALAMERQKQAAKREWKAPSQEQKTLEGGRQTGVGGQGASKEEPHRPNLDFLEAHLANYAMMNAICSVHHTYFKLFFQPNAYTKAKLAAQEKNHLLKKDFSGSQAKFDAYALAQISYRTAFGAMPKPFPFTDLSDGFGQIDSQLYLDGCHFNEQGAGILARALAADLAPIIQSRLEQKPQS
ncbi:hypothetical protein ACXR0O_04740 [Verrucomicrobiota bacterium sgz303538]